MHATTVYRGVATLMLIWAFVHTGESRAEDTPPPPETGPLLSGLSRTPLASIEKDLRTGPFEGRIADADLFLSRPDEFVPTIGAAADLASRIVAAEGGPGANSASSAAGYGQFLRGTWLEIFARTYPQLAQKLSRDQILALREVKPLALELTGRYAQENALSLRRLGLSATEASLSLAHAIGPGGAANILISRHDEPVENVLGLEAIAANPFMKEMTAGTLQRWATNRVGVPAAASQAKRVVTRSEDDFEPLRPSEDFRVDGQIKASQILAENRTAIAALQNLLEVATKIGAGNGTQFAQSAQEWLYGVGVEPAGLLLDDPISVKTFHRSAAGLVSATIHGLTSRATYREFKPIGRRADVSPGLQPAIVRDLARALIERMRKENQTIIAIVRHRRAAGPEATDARS